MPDYLDELAQRQGLSSVERPSSARVYDVLLGGKHNYAIDREFAKKAVENWPDMPDIARSNRAFVGRAVRYAIGQGIGQFVDIGSGLPSEGQAHDIADSEFPDAQARVVYVDYEPIAHAHAEILLSHDADTARHHAVLADFKEPEQLWRKVLDTGAINPDEPVGLLFTAMLHFQSPETGPYQTMAYYRRRAAPGSLVALTHAISNTGTEVDGTVQQFKTATDNAFPRTPDEVSAFFGDWDLVDPGLVWVVDWRPDGQEHRWWGNQPERTSVMAGAARKPLS